MDGTCLFVSDLHGRMERYTKLFACMRERRPACLFIGGDLLPGALFALHTPESVSEDFLAGFIAPGLTRLREELGSAYPRIFVILGNDDGRMAEASVLDLASRGLWEYAHNRRIEIDGYAVYGYSCVPPTPFRLKDWERYDVSRYTDPGCISPEDGIRSIPVSDQEKKWSTISEDLNLLAGDADLSRSVFLFHSPPYRTALDRGALDGMMIDHVPLDVHLGSIAIRRFIEDRQPLLTLHGHIHESTRLTGSWKDEIGRTPCMNAAHDGPELSVIEFSLERPAGAERLLI